MTFFDELQAATETERQALIQIPVIQAGVAGEIDRPTYLAFLTEAYHHVKHTVPLLMACGAKLPERLAWLRTAIGRYIEEEMGHEEWILDDVQACGGDPAAVRDGIPHVATELMVAYAYDTIQRRNAVGFFGMVHVLEGTSIQLAAPAARALQAALNLPAQAFSYLQSHGELDIGHVKFFEQLMNRLDRNEDKAAVIHCAKVVFRLYGNVFASLPWHGEKEEALYATQ